MIPAEAAAMSRAIALAWNGWGRVAPNPMVGCVLLQEGQPVGEGWHAEFGGAHAERVALDAAGERARGAVAVVTLEPCAHQGKRPPCAEALIAAGVQRVVAAVADPDPAAGGGADRLRAAGVEVVLDEGPAEARRQNAPFLHRHTGARRPWVAVKLALSLDGRIADGGGGSRWISGEEARDWVHWFRAGFDAIAVGGRTARADDPSLTVRGVVTPRVPPRRVVFAGREGLPVSLQLLATADRVPTTVVAPPGATDTAVWRSSGAGVIAAEELSGALEQLWIDGVGSLLVEGGGRLAGALLSLGAVDRLCLIQAPRILGAAGVPAISGFDVAVDAPSPWRIVERKPLGADTLLVLERN